MPDKNWQFELEEYIKQGEPEQAEKSEAWQTAIGLQAVDGLKTSEYLLDTAKEHIEGNITIDEAQKRIHSYYDALSAPKPKTKPKRRISFQPESQSSWEKKPFNSPLWNGSPFTVGCSRACSVTPVRSDSTT